MNDEDLLTHFQQLDSLCDRVRNDEPIYVEVLQALRNTYDVVASPYGPAAWHLALLESAIVGLAWNGSKMRKPSARTAVGLNMALAAQRLMLAPLDKVAPPLREPADAKRLQTLLQALDAL